MSDLEEPVWLPVWPDGGHEVWVVCWDAWYEDEGGKWITNCDVFSGEKAAAVFYDELDAGPNPTIRNIRLTQAVLHD